MNLNDINTITSNSYGFRVFDWDNNRGGSDGAGRTLLGKVDLDKYGWEDIFHGTADVLEINDLALTIAQRGLEGMTDQAIANLFNRIIKRFENVEFNGKRYWPTSIHMRVSASMKVPAKPFLFILGDKVQLPSLQSVRNREFGMISKV